MKAVLSGGGTAGHINPALALAEELSARGWEVLFAGTPNGVEARLVAEAGIPFTPFEASGFNRRHPLTAIKGVAAIEKSARAAMKWFDGIRPDVVVGFGGYVSIPVGRAALKRRIPLVIHEQNSIMGLANKYLAKHAEAVCLTYGQAADAASGARRIVETGNPVRSSVLAATRAQGREYLQIGEDALVLLVFGGSLGARHINEALCAMKDALLGIEGLHVVHITGPAELDSVEEALALSDEQRVRWRVCGYESRMGDVLAAADAVVSRAGASSLAEISALGIPALLIPFPFATGDHQTMNARAYVEAGCASMLADSEVGTPRFAEQVLALVQDGQLRAQMRAAAAQQKTRDAAKLLADEVVRAAKRA
jgi:UDP-N-acetylglucosamine--N-acetylmuramyl-(pentapeptide) pyrophosphoryl-undecaprenol N-acetylglucosamine transferase